MRSSNRLLVIGMGNCGNSKASSAYDDIRKHCESQSKLGDENEAVGSIDEQQLGGVPLYSTLMVLKVPLIIVIHFLLLACSHWIKS